MSTNILEKYYSFEKDDLNIEFTGSYQLLKYIIQKYNISNSQITKFAEDNNYSISACKIWSKEDCVPLRVWNIVHKDLIILRLLGKIKEDEVMTLQDLKEEFNFLSNA